MRLFVDLGNNILVAVQTKSQFATNNMIKTIIAAKTSLNYSIYRSSKPQCLWHQCIQNKSWYPVLSQLPYTIRKTYPKCSKNLRTFRYFHWTVKCVPVQYQIFKSFGTSVSESKSESSGLFEVSSNISELNLVLLNLVVPLYRIPIRSAGQKFQYPQNFEHFKTEEP